MEKSLGTAFIDLALALLIGELACGILDPIHVEKCAAIATFPSFHDRRNLPEDSYGVFWVSHLGIQV